MANTIKPQTRRLKSWLKSSKSPKRIKACCWWGVLQATLLTVTNVCSDKVKKKNSNSSLRQSRWIIELQNVYRLTSQISLDFRMQQITVRKALKRNHYLNIKTKGLAEQVLSLTLRCLKILNLCSILKGTKYLLILIHLIKHPPQKAYYQMRSILTTCHVV